MSFQDLKARAIGFIEAEYAKLEGMFVPLAEQALKSGATTIATDAAALAVQVAADPSLVTDQAKRDSIVSSLKVQLANQGAVLEDNTLHAFAAAALATLPPLPTTATATVTEAQPGSTA